MISTRQHIRDILRLGTPIVIAQLGVVVQGIADTVMVGHYGTPELSAAGFVNNIYNLIIFFLLGLSYSTTPVAGAFWSSNQRDKARRTLSESCIIGIQGSITVIALLMILYFNIEVLDQPQELLPLIKPYFLVLAASLPFMAIFNSYKQYSDAIGDTKTPMYVMIASNILNIIGNYILIFTCDMGLLGAGFATFLSRVMLAVTMIYLLRTPEVKLRRTKEGFRKLTRLGLPISFQLCLEASSFNICAIFMGWISATALAAHQILCTLSQVVFLVHYGIGAAAAISISHYVGKKNRQEVRRVTYTAYGMSLFVGIVLSTIVFIMRRPLLELFTIDADVIATGMLLFIPYVVYQVGDCTQIIFSNALRGIGRVKAMITDAAIAYVVVSLPMSYLFAFTLGYGAVGVWWGMPFGLTTAGVIFLLRFIRYSK